MFGREKTSTGSTETRTVHDGDKQSVGMDMQDVRIPGGMEVAQRVRCEQMGWRREEDIRVCRRACHVESLEHYFLQPRAEYSWKDVVADPQCTMGLELVAWLRSQNTLKRNNEADTKLFIKMLSFYALHRLS